MLYGYDIMADDPQPSDARPTRDLFVEFANAPWDTAEELGAWLATADLGPLTPSRSSVARDQPAFVALRELVRAIAARADVGLPPTRVQVRSLNRVMRDGPHAHELLAHAGGTAFTVVAAGETPAQIRSTIAVSLASFLADDGSGRLRLCASDSCRWLFVDRSPGGRRRWCDMRVCGNRSKVRRHRERARRRPISAAENAHPRRALDTLT
ncbi:MAG TPA: CGNR zinc finger domain-containing protein [Candidatus Limnocylindria bacterium]